MRSNYIYLTFRLLLPASSAFADSSEPDNLIHSTLVPIAAYGEQNPGCREWTDSCSVCRRISDKEFACSTPGIACQPGGVTCKEIRNRQP